MAMKLIDLIGLEGENASEVLAANSIVATQIVIQNRSQGPIYLWADAAAPTKERSGILIKSGEIYSFVRGSNTKLFIEGHGRVVLMY